MANSSVVGKIIIVGRPNVGKSSLFNRIISSRRALVSDYPGTTIDYIESETTINGVKFTVVDTGGWTPHDTKRGRGVCGSLTGVTGSLVGKNLPSVRDRMRQFVEKLLSDCHRRKSAVIFVVDAKEGLNPLDMEFANYLRKKNLTDDIIIAANKSDTDKRELAATEFYKLGFGEPIAVSAQNGRNVNELLEKAAAHILGEVTPSLKNDNLNTPLDDDKKEYAEATSIPKVMILGRPNAGKSTLFNRLAGYERSIVDATPGTTRESINAIAALPDGKILEIIDSPGITRARKFKNQGEGKETAPLSYLSFVSATRYITRADVAVLLIDATEGITKADESLAGMISENNLGAVVAFNKWDSVPDGKRENLFRQLSEDFRHRFNFLSHARFTVISALTGSGVARNLLPAIFSVYKSYCIKPDPQKISAIIKDAILSKPLITPSGTRRLAFSKIISTSSRPPSVKIAVNEPSLIHFSYKRYLLNSVREKYTDLAADSGAPLVLNFVKN